MPWSKETCLEKVWNVYAISVITSFSLS